MSVPETSLVASAGDAPVVLEISARGQRLPAAHRVPHWPLVIGRAVDADLVLTDPSVAPHHLRVAPDAAGALQVEVLDTRNGVRHAGRHHGTGSVFSWQPGVPLGIGPIEVMLRAAGSPLAPEQLWHRRGTGGWLLLLGGVLLTLLLVVFQGWLGSDRPGEFLRSLPVLVLGTVAVMLGWCGAWALLGKLLTGHAQFLRHLGVAVAGYVALELVLQAAHAAAFAFSWPVLARFDRAITIAVLAPMLWAHLRLATHGAPRLLGALVAAMAVAAIAVPMALSWQQSRRMSDTLYMSEIYPPGWRLVAPKSVDDFVRGAQAMVPPLERRRDDRSDEVDGQVDELD